MWLFVLDVATFMLFLHGRPRQSRSSVASLPLLSTLRIAPKCLIVERICLYCILVTHSYGTVSTYNFGVCVAGATTLRTPTRLPEYSVLSHSSLQTFTHVDLSYMNHR
jgi:hypothetical protein